MCYFEKDDEKDDFASFIFTHFITFEYIYEFYLIYISNFGGNALI